MRAAALRLSLALLAVTAIATACGTDTATRGRGGSGGGGGGGGGVTDTGTGGSDTGGSDTGGSDTGTDTTPVDCHETFANGGPGGDACLTCTTDACASEAAAAYGANFPTSVGGACASLYACLMACPCDTANPGDFAADCAIPCVTNLPAACQTATQALQTCQTNSCATECAEPVSTCGDNVVDPDEDCDGAAPSCTELGFDGGFAFCGGDCTIDTSGCTNTSANCGNGVVDIGEACDGNNLQGSGCTNFGYTGGTLSCTDVCDLNFSNCTSTTPDVCGDGFISGGEQCEGNNLAGESCVSLGYDSGTLRCSGCTFNVSSCVITGPVCGNRVIEAGETCDGTNVNGVTCADFGATAGTVRCTSDCLDYDTSGCTADPFCGDGIVNGTETCDGFEFGFDSCANQGFVGGSLSCNFDCTTDYSGCSDTAANLCDPFSAGALFNGSISGVLSSSDSLGGPQSAYFDAYRAFLFAGDILTVTMSSSVTGFDSYLALYGGGACALLTSDDDSGGGTSGRDSSFTFDVTSGGDYYVVATGYSASSLGAYTLTVSF